MKGLPAVVLGVLMLSAGAALAADRQAGPELSATAAAKLERKLDLNTVSTEDLLEVPGIGPRLAQEIVDHRSRKGAFKRVEDLLEVTGIKEKKLASISRYLEVVPLAAAAAAPAPSAQTR